MSMFSMATVPSIGTVGFRTNQEEPSSPRSSPEKAMKMTGRASPPRSLEFLSDGDQGSRT